MSFALNLDMVFLLKGILAALLGVVLFFSSHFTRTRTLGFFIAYLGFSAAHAWTHMLTLGSAPSLWARELLGITQTAAWLMLALSALNNLPFFRQQTAWKISSLSVILILALCIPHMVPACDDMPKTLFIAAPASIWLLAMVSFWLRPPFHVNGRNLQRAFMVLALLPIVSSFIFPLSTCSTASVPCLYTTGDVLREGLEMLLYFAAFVVLHVFLFHEQREILKTPFGRKTMFHMQSVSALLVLVTGAGWVEAGRAGAFADRLERSRLLQHLHNASLAFSPREVDLLSGTPDDMGRLHYQDMKRRLQELLRANPQARFSYLMALRGDDVVFLADSEPDDSPDRSLPGTVYQDASPLMRQVLAEGKEAVEGPLPDAWGIWISPLTPVGGRTRALLGMDVDAKHWQRMLLQARQPTLLAVWLFSMLLLGVFIYIRKLAESQLALSASEEKYRILFEQSMDAYLLLRDTFVDCNTAAERLFGRPREEIIGRTPAELSPERQPDGTLSSRMAQEHMARAFAGEPQAFSWIHKDSAGNSRHTEVRLNLLPMNPPTLQAIVRDRTEEIHQTEKRRQMENRMAEMQKWEGLANLAGGVAHDFNNLITAIVGNVHLAQMESQNTEQVQSCHNAILENARMATELARQMLAYAGKGSLSVRPFSLDEVLRHMEKVLKSVAQSKARIELELEPDLPATVGDATQIQQVVLNLVVNAVEAIDRPDGCICISLKKQYFSAEEMHDCVFREPPSSGPYLVLRVRDNGRGIAPETLPRIFEPFFTTKFTGRGLGLAAVAGIVHNHGGAIRVQSTPKEGTEFEVRLPASTKKAESKQFAQPPEESENDTPAVTQLRVLVVEDEDGLRQLTVRMLQRYGHHVLSASNGAEGLQLVRENRGKLDVVVADVLMPKVDGIELARQIKKEFPDLPVVLTSGHVPGDNSDYLTVSDAFLPKPYHYKELLKKIYEVLAKPTHSEK